MTVPGENRKALTCKLYFGARAKDKKPERFQAPGSLADNNFLN